MLNVLSFQHLVQKKPQTYKKNTKLVRHLIEGLATINRKWPLRKNARFSSNLVEYKKKNIPVTEFDFPSDEELALL